ncbi:hypothetical protein [Chryseobacterium sp. T1]
MAQQSTSSKKKINWKKIGLIVGASFLIIILIFPFALDAYLKKKLPDIINEKTPYNVKLESFDVSLLSGNLHLKNIDINTKNPTDSKITQINGTIANLDIENLKIIKAIFSKKYIAENIKIINPNLNIQLTKKNNKKHDSKSNPEINVKNIVVQNAKLNVLDSLGKGYASSETLSLNLKEISLNNKPSKIPLAFKSFEIDAKKLLLTVNDFYQIKAETVSAKDKHLEMDNFHLIPTQKPHLYNAKNVFDFQMQRFVADGIWINNDSLIADKTIFVSPNLKIISTNKSIVKENPKEIDIKIALKNLELQSGQLLVENTKLEKQASVKQFDVKLSDIVFDKNTVKEKIPFHFNNHDINISDVYFRADNHQSLTLDKAFSNNQNINLEGFHLTPIGKNPHKNLWDINLEKLLIVNNQSKLKNSKLNLNISEIKLQSPKIKMIAAQSSPKSTPKAQKSEFDFQALIGKITLENGSFKQIEANGKEKMSVQKFDIQLNQLTSDSKLIKNDIPFKIANHHINLRNFNLDAGRYYNLLAKSIDNSGKETKITDFAFKPKYSRKAFSKVIKQQEDLYDITAKQIVVFDKIDLFQKHETIQLDKIILDGVRCSIYHDLAPPEDIALRSMFSEKLRNIKMPMYIQEIQLKNSYISYEEDAVNNNKPGKLYMSNFNANIKDVGNGKITGKPTLVKVNTNFDFYGSAPSKVYWTFDVLDKTDAFKINGVVSKLSADNVNLFVRPYLNISLDGDIHTVKFDYLGDKTVIKGDFLLLYNDLYVNFMNKKSGEKRKLISKVVNLLIRNDSKENADSKKIEKKREPTRSFFNMLWQGLMEGLKKTLI